MTDEERAADFAKAHISPELKEPVMRWATEAFESEFGWENVFYTPEAALAAQERFGLTGSFLLLGIGLPVERLEAFLLEAAPPPRQEGYSPVGETGSYRVAKKRKNLAEGGRFLGFELLNIDFGSIQHSWICNGLERHCRDHLEVRPNGYGLISEIEEAFRCCEEISRDEVGSEPGLWLPCGIVLYDDVSDRGDNR